MSGASALSIDSIVGRNSDPTINSFEPASLSVSRISRDDSRQLIGTGMTFSNAQPKMNSKNSIQLRSMNDKRSCRSEGHTSELQSLMSISYAVFCLKKKTTV